MSVNTMASSFEELLQQREDLLNQDSSKMTTEQRIEWHNKAYELSLLISKTMGEGIGAHSNTTFSSNYLRLSEELSQLLLQDPSKMTMEQRIDLHNRVYELQLKIQKTSL